MIKKSLYIFLISLLIGNLLISSYFIYKEFKQNKEQDQTFEELIEVVEETTQENEKNSEINLYSLYEMNNDLVGWIRIENTNINYPVVKSKVKNYYLRKDFYKNYSSYGTPFLAENCNVNVSDNLIIYGHHMRNRKMFGSLEDYKSKSFYEKNKIIDFYTLDGDETVKTEYEIFAVFKTVAYSSNGFKYYNYINFNNKEDYEDFIDRVKQLSLYDTGIKAEYGDEILTLSTCEYSNKNGRLVVMARKMK